MDKNKNKLVGLSMVACAFAMAGAMLWTSNPKAVSATDGGLTIIQGASVRLTTAEDDVAVNGLRFGAQMTKAYYDALQGTEVVLSSTVTANGVDKTVEWVLKSATKEVCTPSFSDGVASFYHTLTFDSLFGAENASKLKQANAFDFEASYELESNVDAEDWTGATQTRSMQQVAYKAYRTPDDDGYQNEQLKSYFSEGEADEGVYYSATTDDRTVATVFGAKVYADYNGRFVNVSDLAIKDLYVETATPNFIFFDENNVAHTLSAQLATLISTPEQMASLLTSGTTKNGEYYALTNNIYISQLDDIVNTLEFKGILDGNGYTVYAPQRMYGLFGNIMNGAVIKNMKLVVDMSTANAFRGASNEANILSIKVYKATLENLYVKMIGDGAGIQYHGFGLFAFDNANHPSTFKNLVLDYADMLPAQPTDSNKYSSLFGMYSINGTAENIQLISSTTNWMSYQGKTTVNDCNYATLYTDIANIPVNTLNAKYWDTTGEKPVWKTDEVVDNNTVIWSANTQKAYVLDGLLPEGEYPVSVTDVASNIAYYENGTWNTDSLPANVGDSTVMKFYKTVKVVGSNGTVVTTIANGYNCAIAEASDMDFIAPDTTLAGKYIMVDNVTVESWTYDALGSLEDKYVSTTEFNGVFDGNGYTLTFPQRAYGLFGNINVGSVIKNVRLNVIARKQIGDNTKSLDVTLNRGAILGVNLYGTFKNSYVQVSGTPYTQGIGLVINMMAAASLENVVLDYGSVYNFTLTGYGYKGYLTCMSQVPYDGAVLSNVYILAQNSTKYLHERGSKHGYTPRVVAENEYDASVTEPVAEIKLDGVRRYNDVDAVKADTSAGKDLTGFDSTYWVTTSGAPVWNTK